MDIDINNPTLRTTNLEFQIGYGMDVGVNPVISSSWSLRHGASEDNIIEF